MTVHFIGAGPGAADLITLRGRDLLARCELCLYAGSVIPPALLAHGRPDAVRIDTAPLTLDEIEALCVDAEARGWDTARLHSGDLAAYSAVGEQLARLRARSIPTRMVPGVSALGASAAALDAELTVPGLVQSVVTTRLSGRASPVPEAEALETFARTGATLAIHLSVHRLAEIVARLTPILGPDCPAALLERVTWPEARIVRATLATLLDAVGDVPPRLALVLVGRALDPALAAESRLYAPGHARRFRPSASADTPPR